MEKIDTPAEKYVEDKHDQHVRKLGGKEEEGLARYTEAIRKLSIPFSDYVYENEGTMELELKGEDEEGKESATKIVLEYSSGQNAQSILNPNDKEYSKSIRKIKRLYIESKRFVLDTDKMPIPKHGIFFKTKNNFEGGGSEELQIVTAGGYNYMANEVTINFPLNTPIGISVLLHELGHFLRAKESEETRPHLVDLYYTLDKYPERLTAEDRVAILEEERGADAVALREATEFLKPVVDQKTIEDFINGSLLLYSNRLVKKES